jgi:hypothetical protein
MPVSVPTMKRERFSDGFGSNVVLRPPAGPIITLHGLIAARDYVERLGKHVHPMIQTVFPNSDEVFQEKNAPIHAAGTVQSWFEKRDGARQYLPWSAQSPNLNITEPHWLVLESRVRNRFPPPTSLKQLEDDPKKNGKKFR